MGIKIKWKPSLLWLVGIIVLLTNGAYAQFHATYYQRDDGLPANLTKTTIQDQLGFIWIGTDLGLVRYDGKRFEAILDELPSPYVKSFFTTRDSQVVAVTDEGLVSIISKPDSIGVQPYNPLENGDSLSLLYPKSAHLACDGSVWIADERRVSRVTSNGFNPYAFDTYSVNFLRSVMMWEEGCGEMFVALPSGSFAMLSSEEEDFVPLALQISSSITVDRRWPKGRNLAFHGLLHTKDGRVVVASDVGLLVFRIDPVRREAILEDWVLRGVSCTHAIEARNNRIFVGTFNNGFHYAPSLSRIDELKRVNEVPFQVVNYAYIDREENIWVNGDGGVVMLKQDFFTTVPAEGLDPFMYDISEDGKAVLFDRSGALYELVEGKTGFQWVKQGGHVFEVPSTPLIGAAVRMVVHDHVFYAMDSTQGVVWRSDIVGKTPIRIKEASNLSYGWVKRDGYGNLWLDSYDAGPFKIEPDGTVKEFRHPLGQGTLFTIIGNDPKEVYFSAGNNSDHYLYRYHEGSDALEDISIPIPETVWRMRDEVVFLPTDLVKDSKGDYWLGTSAGLLRISNGFIGMVDLGKEFANQPINMVMADRQGGLWIATNVALLYYRNGEVHEFNEPDGLPTSVIEPEGLMVDKGRLWVATPSGIAYSQENATVIQKSPAPIFTKIEVNGAPVKLEDRLKVPYLANIEADATAPTYPSEKVIYRYRLNHRENEPWSAPSLSGVLELPQMDAGSYQLEVQAKQRGNYEWSLSSRINIEVRQIWYKTWWGVLSAILGLLGIIYLSIRVYGARLRQLKQILENTVAERTQEIRRQKEQLSDQNRHLQELHEDLKEAFNELHQQKEDNERKTQNITDSINYASRIQGAILPSKTRMEHLLPDHFVFYRPRDIVSGDFYWCNAKDEDRTILVVADCTGHGVPGAFMSMIGSVLLNQIVFIKGIDNPSGILTELNRAVQESLNQEGNKSRDGMDISICVIDRKQQTLSFAAAKGQIVFISDGVAQRVKGDNVSVGGEYAPLDTEYSLYQWPLSSVQAFYMFSDGYQDQFGGPQGKKFMSKQFRKMLTGIYELPVQDQLSHLQFTLDYWTKPDGKTDYAQIDDVLVVGVKL